MKNKLRYLAAVVAVFICLCGFNTVAYAGGGEDIPEETTEATEITTETEAETEKPANPFTPDGTGTVVDTATNEDGKQFYTISTPEGNIFYLIIDLERDSDNVYFLDAVTEKDLLTLAAQAEEADDTEATAPTVTPEPEVTPDPEPETTPVANENNNGGIIFFVILAVVAAGGAGYYFKIYRPKQQDPGEDDYDEDEDGEVAFEDNHPVETEVNEEEDDEETEDEDDI